MLKYEQKKTNMPQNFNRENETSVYILGARQTRPWELVSSAHRLLIFSESPLLKGDKPSAETNLSSFN